MKPKAIERKPHTRLREVSDLRTQFQCEYRLYLKQKCEESSSEASLMGSILHTRIGDTSRLQKVQEGRGILPLLIIIMTLVIGLLWIIW
ncbi:MAG: hypothetical protein ACFFES_11520 [Candidatus Thorarchaeota archaeon]